MMDSFDPYRRPARRTQWIVSTLAYHYGLDRGVENEIIVLATGLDQYLQEIFHHLDYESAGKIPVEDFNFLCELLGVGVVDGAPSGVGVVDGAPSGVGVVDGAPSGVGVVDGAPSGVGVVDGAPSELTFRHFHAKLCGYFSTRAGCRYEDDRPLVGEDSRHIETQIRLRSPLKRPEACSRSGAPPGGPHSPLRGSCSGECYEDVVALEAAEDRIGKLEEENASLRELVEDMRAALQSSDARCLALQVGLWKNASKQKQDRGCVVSQQRLVMRGPTSNLESLQNIIHEMELMQQVKEVLLCNQRLEQELWSSKEAVAAMEDCNQALMTEQANMRRKVEEARQALLTGLSKVKELEVKASHVPALQRQILQLEAELVYYRSEVSKSELLSSCGSAQQPCVHSRSQRCCLDSQHGRCSPAGRTMTTPDKMEEQLFRSVEGQASSDEEEDKWTRAQQKQVDEVKRILTRLSCCSERCDNRAFNKFMSNFDSSRSEESHSAVVELLERVTRLHRQLELKESQAEMDTDQMKNFLMQELQQKAEETELLQVELQMLETERVRLTLVEEKLVDILQLLQQLRDVNISRRSLGKILISTLESGSNPQHGKAHILEVLNALYHELVACEILSAGGPLERTQSQPTLIISC